MTQQWYEPSSFKELFKRVFSFLNITAFLIIAILIFSELRFNWLEVTIGKYLNSTNQTRPQTGAIWQTEKQTSNAHKDLNEIVTKKENIRQNVLNTSSFFEFVSSVLPGEWITLEKKQFKNLYLGLDESIASQIISPAQILSLFSNNLFDRIFCEGTNEGINIYFIDSENKVIKQLKAKKQKIKTIENNNKLFLGTLSDMNEFYGRIYPADIFFHTLNQLPDDIVSDLILNPKKLLLQDAKIIRVGIWNEAQNGYIKLGFEFDTKEGKQIMFMRGREWAVWQLSIKLKGEKK